MSFDVAFVIKVFAALFAIMNPIANIPVFLSLTEGASREAQRKVAITATIGGRGRLRRLRGRRRGDPRLLRYKCR